MFSNNSLPVESVDSLEEQKKIDVVVDSTAVDGRVSLKLSTWVDGLGWCVQKTLTVEGDQIDELQRALTVARHRVNRKRGEAGVAPEPARVIQMPRVA